MGLVEDPLLKVIDLLHFKLYETRKAQYAESQENTEVMNLNNSESLPLKLL